MYMSNKKGRIRKETLPLLYRSHCEAPQCKVVMNLTSSSPLVEFNYQSQQMPCTGRNGYLIGGSDTVCVFHHRPINPSGMQSGNSLTQVANLRKLMCFCTTNILYSGRTKLYLQLSRSTNLLVTLLALQLSELPNWNLYLSAVFHPTTGSYILYSA